VLVRVCVVAAVVLSIAAANAGAEDPLAATERRSPPPPAGGRGAAPAAQSPDVPPADVGTEFPPLARCRDRSDCEDTRVHVVVPPPAPLERRGLYFYGKERVEVPGIVSINRRPYVCDVDHRTFRDKQTFVAHLRVDHAADFRRSADPFVIRDGQVHFPGN
jgi:hypothetical protein